MFHVKKKMLQRSWGHTHIYIYIIDCLGSWSYGTDCSTGVLLSYLVYWGWPIMVPLSWAALGGSNAWGRSFKERKRSEAGGARKALVRIVWWQINAVGPEKAGFEKNAEIGRIIFKNLKMFFFGIWFSVFPQQMVPRIIVCGSCFFRSAPARSHVSTHTRTALSHTSCQHTAWSQTHNIVRNIN